MTAGALIVLQARTGSTRLPAKVLAPVDGQPILAHCIARLLAAHAGPLVVATTRLPADDEVARLSAGLGARVVRGATDDVLDRFRVAIASWDGPFVIRATADNPAVDLEAPGRVLQHLAEGADYVVEAGLPVGAAVEGVRTEVLRLATTQATTAYDREHVTPWVKSRSARFRVALPDAPAGLRRPDLRLTVDTADDLAWVDAVLTAVGAGTRMVPLADIIRAADRLARPSGR